MNETLPPLSAQQKQVLALAAEGFEPPLGTEERVFARLGAALALPAPATPPTPGLGVKAASTLALTALLTGVGVGVVLDRSLTPPPPPQVVERIVRVEVPAAPLPAPGVELLAPAPPPRRVEAKPPPTPPAPVEPPSPVAPPGDASLARERELVETARSALLRANAPGALAALQAHAEQFPAGRLEEERESLWVQALALEQDGGAARARAAAFHLKFPLSLLGPTVDAAVGE
jgi:hypothetical protein